MNEPGAMLVAGTRLDARRLAGDEWRALAPGAAGVLGGLVWGSQGDGHTAPESKAASGGVSVPPLLAPVHARLLEPRRPVVDVLFAGGNPVYGQSGAVHWRHDGEWLFGTLALEESGAPGALAALTRHAYRDVFATLRDTGCAHLVRMWNYLAAINADDAGLERYRRFNLGRHEAFVEAGLADFEGAPAACALGTRDGPLCVSFLAARTRPLAIENPRQVPAWRYPSDYGPRSPTFSRATLADAGDGRLALFISGTASIVGHTSMRVGDAGAQTREVIANLRAVVGAARARCSAHFELETLTLTVYLRRADDAAAIRAVLESELGAETRAVREALLVEGDVCRAELLVEIEALGFAFGRLRA